VAIVGGGVIGLGVGYELARAGAEVTVVERNRVGSGASLGNAGWITPALCAMPVPAPGVVSQALKWMLKPDSPLLLRPRLDPVLLAWLWQFRAASRPTRFAAGRAALIAHNRGAVAALLRWRSDGVEFELHESGLVFLALRDDVLEEEQRLYTELRTAGFPVEFERLDRTSLREREACVSDAVVGGLVSPGEWHVRPESLTAGLAAALGRAGAQILEGVAVDGLTQSRDGWSLTSSVGAVEADRVVLATGAWAPSLLSPLGYRLPLQPAKGYSITSVGEGVRPRHALYLIEARVGCSPFVDAVRLAGTLELGGLGLELDGVRLGALARAAAKYLRWRPTDVELAWAGLRPLAPDGLPVIGPVPGYEGLFVSTGHGMAGVTLAAASAALLAPWVLDDVRPAALIPLSPARFG
jgi:D-amino-acid dehydrogenase